MSAIRAADGGFERFPDGRMVWKCNHCGVTGSWTESWTWFGSEFDADELPADQKLTFCCREHGDEHERALPHLFEKKRRSGR